MEPPSVEFDLSPIQYVEIAKAVKHMKSGASPCPFDHISILVFKNCPILRTYLYRIINKCWLERSIPGVWKNGFTILIYKKITLEPVRMKILSSIIRRRLYNFLIKNSYVESDIQNNNNNNNANFIYFFSSQYIKLAAITITGKLPGYGARLKG